MSMLTIISSFGWFIVFISIIVFVHEMGHFYMARKFGVHVKVFSIGFGQTLWSTVDKLGTCWKISAIPLGGYVQMQGDQGPASLPDYDELKQMDEAQLKASFFNKPLWQKSLIVAAGPFANYLLSLLIFTFLLYLNGINFVMPIITTVTPDSPAYKAGLLSGDKIIMVDQQKIKTFQEVQKFVMVKSGESLLFTLERQGEMLEVSVAPELKEISTPTGDKIKVPVLGIASNAIEHHKLNIFTAVYYATIECYKISQDMLTAIWRILTGDSASGEIGGPIKIAQYSGAMAKMGAYSVLWFIAMLSLNLGLVNLLPIPLLDGGHLMVYFFEALRGGKPLPPLAYSIMMRMGAIILIGLMVFALGNDLVGIFR